MTADDFQQGRQGAGRDRKAAFAAGGGEGVGVALPGSKFVRKLRLDFAASQSLPVPVVNFAESLAGLHRQVVWFADNLRSVHGLRKRRSVGRDNSLAA